MPVKINKNDALKHIQDYCNLIKEHCSKMIQTTYAKQIVNNVDEFFDYYKNAVESANPFIKNVNAMRAQGLWLPDKINDNSVREVYFKVAKGYALKIINNEAATAAINSVDKYKMAAIYTAVKDINKYLDNLIEGRSVINEV